MKRIAFITDIHLDEKYPLDQNVDPAKNFEVVLAHIEKERITDLVFGGDIGEHTSHRYFFERLRNFSLNIVLGNHDKFEQVSEHFIRDRNKQELYYKTQDENFQYVFLDTSADEVSKSQLQWLQDELTDNKELVLFLHHPVLEVEAHIDQLYPLKNREELKSILLNFKTNVTVFCGHYHMNDEQKYRNIKQYTTQALSYQVIKSRSAIEIDNLNFGYRIIEFNETKIDTKAINFINE